MGRTTPLFNGIDRQKRSEIQKMYVLLKNIVTLFEWQKLPLWGEDLSDARLRFSHSLNRLLNKSSFLLVPECNCFLTKMKLKQKMLSK